MHHTYYYTIDLFLQTDIFAIKKIATLQGKREADQNQVLERTFGLKR